MRTFNNESVWDKENQEWVELYYIDGQEVDADTYCEQLEVEEVATEDENCEDSCQCECCEYNCNEELADWQKQIVAIVEDFADRIENDECECGCSLRNMLVDMFFIARQIGFEDGMECGINSVEEKTVNINIDELTIDSDFNFEDFVEELKQCLGKNVKLKL